eukprot:TRINITY_DN14088_c0_g1_i1.p1 TRINITY_DN14088_c0_g1~~TRINITY_DN14088_c0_g1_i1.p1  ORF type:complete len:312 (-),score=58.55 TRINITY_DN14088_c0_g1_i1:93-908(-)
MVVQTVLNIIFVFKEIRGLDNEFKSHLYSRVFIVLSVIILALSVPFTLQTTRILFAEFMEIRLFHSSINDNDGFMSLLNKYSFIQAVTVELLILATNVYGFTRTSWGTRLNRTMIESSTLSLALLVLLLENSVRSQLQTLKDKVIPIIPITELAGNDNNAVPRATPQHEAQAKASSIKIEERNEGVFPSSQRELLVKVEDLIKESELPEEAKDDYMEKKESESTAQDGRITQSSKFKTETKKNFTFEAGVDLSRCLKNPYTTTEVFLSSNN